MSLVVDDLTVRYGDVLAVDSLSFALAPGEVLGVVGPSGCGKSTLALSVLGLLSPGATTSGSIRWRDEELLGASEARLASIRGKDIAIVFQDAGTAFNPVRRIGDQLAEAVQCHDRRIDRVALGERVIALLDLVGIDSPKRRAEQHPHELSGGMRQRALIAMAMANDPEVLIADEPTSALDVTVQAQVLDVLERVRERTGFSLLLITHDLGVVARMADRVLPMVGGASTGAVAVGDFAWPPVPFFVDLPGPEAEPPMAKAEPLLVVTGLTKRFGATEAVAGVDLYVAAGETLAVVGESGSGKTTTMRCIARLEDATGGRITFDGVDLGAARGGRLRELRRRFQVVFQDPAASLNPRLSVAAAVIDPLRVHGLHRGRERERAAELLGMVGLAPELLDRYPHELSGGQRQRVGIARALAVEPELLVLDEPVSSLDADVRAEILELLASLQERLGLALLLVAHDLEVVGRIADRVAVFHLGTVVEEGPVVVVFGRAAHPYTQALLSAVPVPDPTVERGRERIVLVGDPPSPSDPPSGCRFRTRCWLRAKLDAEGADTAACGLEPPALIERSLGHPVACHFA
jgi:peptide/nickel transport system ATP-binding protein